MRARLSHLTDEYPHHGMLGFTASPGRRGTISERQVCTMVLCESLTMVLLHVSRGSGGGSDFAPGPLTAWSALFASDVANGPPSVLQNGIWPQRAVPCRRAPIPQRIRKLVCSRGANTYLEHKLLPRTTPNSVYIAIITPHLS
jgi:hypothetical protein